MQQREKREQRAVDKPGLKGRRRRSEIDRARPTEIAYEQDGVEQRRRKCQINESHDNGHRQTLPWSLAQRCSAFNDENGFQSEKVPRRRTALTRSNRRQGSRGC